MIIDIITHTKHTHTRTHLQHTQTFIRARLRGKINVHTTHTQTHTSDNTAKPPNEKVNSENTLKEKLTGSTQFADFR